MIDAFVFFAAGAMCLAGAVGVVALRNPVHNALSLVLTLFGVAVLFVSEEAHFLAVVQVIVYAGAIVVLITFVIMLLNLQPEAQRGAGLISLSGAFVLGALLIAMLGKAGLGFQPIPEGADPLTLESTFGSVRSVGQAMFTVYFYPFLLVTLALLAAMAGAVLLAKRELED